MLPVAASGCKADRIHRAERYSKTTLLDTRLPINLPHDTKKIEESGDRFSKGENQFDFAQPRKSSEASFEMLKHLGL